ncbi:hypothetical protein OT109_02760 [Phycisphaeraceae bacterium D3-23]
MTLRFLIPALLGLLILPASSQAGDDEGDSAAIVRQLDVSPGRDIFDSASRAEPLEIASAADAAAHFDADALAALNDAVDWETEHVMVFAWRGSGQDRMTAQVDADNPDTVRFVYTPGRTRDLRPHVYVYVVKQGVVWEVATGRPGPGRGR